MAISPSTSDGPCFWNPPEAPSCTMGTGFLQSLGLDLGTTGQWDTGEQRTSGKRLGKENFSAQGLPGVKPWLSTSELAGNQAWLNLGKEPAENRRLRAGCLFLHRGGLCLEPASVD